MQCEYLGHRLFARLKRRSWVESVEGPLPPGGPGAVEFCCSACRAKVTLGNWDTVLHNLQRLVVESDVEEGEEAAERKDNNDGGEAQA